MHNLRRRLSRAAHSLQILTFTAVTRRRLKHEHQESMNALQLKANWNIIKGKLKQKYAALTDDDLVYVEGKERELIGRIQKRTGKTTQELEEAFGCEDCRKN
jgi:uncharacterized protein YjbJ (UPF0337 family)